MKRLLKTALSLVNLKKAISFGSIFAATKNDLYLIKSPKTNFEKVLILAPHPDDDVFGMGGTIKKMTTAGTEVTVAYFCDGAGGVPEGRPKSEEIGISGRRDENLIPLRKEEAQKSAKILGINETIFWGYPDGKLASGTSSVRALQDLIKRFKPDIIFLPSFLDNHGDHRVVNAILINAATGVISSDFPIWSYEIWTPIFINRLVDISLYIKTKTEAILCHETQLKTRRYDKAIIAFNQYRSEINDIQGYGEGFFVASFKIYKELYRKS